MTASTIFGMVLFSQCFAASISSSVLAGLADSSDTIRALDTDGNGRVSLAEIKDFAQKNGISAAEIENDFNDLDSNRDGELDPQEISGLFAAGAEDSSTEQSQAPANVNDAKAPAELQIPAPESVVSSATASRATAKAVMKPATSLEELEAQVQRQAGGVLAEGFARSAEARIKQGEKDEKSATSFAVTATTLRSKIHATTKAIAAEAKRAAQTAAAAAAKPGLEKARKLNLQADRLEREAAQHRNRASQALQNAMQAQSALSSGSKHPANSFAE